MFFALARASGMRVAIGLRTIEGKHVVHERPIAWSDFDGLHPLRLGKPGRHVEKLVSDRSRRWNRIVLLHFQHDVGLTQRPSFGEGGSGREVLRISLECAGRGPRAQCLPFRIRQDALVVKRAGRRVRMPWRHRALCYGVGDGLCVRS